MTVMRRAAVLEAQGSHIVHMEVGEPDFATAAPIVDAAIAALRSGKTHYTQAPGIDQLRDCLVEHYACTYGVKLNRERILITPGGSAGLSLLAHLLVRPGDGILLTDPGYPCVRNFIHLVHGHPQLVPLDIAQNFQPSLEQLDEYRSRETAGIWLASPSNPTGVVIGREQLKSIVEWKRENNLHLLMDEIYHGLHYTDDLPSVLELDQDSFVVNSFSKYFGMTGWRLGWIVVPEEFVHAATILAQNLYISAPIMAQFGALAAFTPQAREIFEQRRHAFRQRRDFMTKELSSLGFLLPEQTHGAFYLYGDISSFAADSEDFCKHALENHGVALTPGTDFGEHRANHFVRIAFTTSMENLERGVERLRQAVT
ncbi:MAG: aminotransferase class I/II-fold pyridoxal phosphate-dependent enzyme [Gammaproteobacteria bacterium]